MDEQSFAALFSEFLALYKVVNRKPIIELLQAELKSDLYIDIYLLSDGDRSTREIADLLTNRCSHSTVANLWNRWALLGIVASTKQKGRYKSLFDLSEYGIANTISEKGNDNGK